MKKTSFPKMNPSAVVREEVDGGETQRPEEADLLRKVAKLLEEGHPDSALKVLSHGRISSPWVRNATGVCLLRLGEGKRAVDLFRGMVLASGGVILRDDVPKVFKTNFAAALLACNNVSGCLRVLNEVHDEQNPAVQQLYETIRRWKASMSLWQKFQWFTGGLPDHPVVFASAPGGLE